MPRAAAPKPTDLALDESAARVLRRFRIVFNSVRAHFREVEQRAGIAGAQLWALSIIREQPGIGVSQLARAMDIHQSTASNLLRPLVQQGLVVADRAQADRRALRLQVSAAGARLLRKAPGPMSGLLPQALARLDTRTLARLERDLGALIEVLDGDEKTARLPLGRPDR
jgi:DNA-binding MarR family transcriptional regulator